MDADQKYLEKDLNYVFSNFDKVIHLSIYDKLEKTRENVMSDGQHGNLFRQPLTRVIIKDNAVEMSEYLIDRLEFWKKVRDVRLEYFVEQCNVSLEWARINLQRTVKYAILHIWIADGYPWFLGNVFKSMPIFSFCRSNYDGEYSNIPIWPDTTMYKMFLETKYSRNVLSFDEMKQYLVSNLYKGPKEKCIFFHGANTTWTTHNIRMMFAKHTKPIAGVKLKVLLDNEFEPIYNWSKYEYLIDLPGHAPWSNRLNFLPLLGCKIIHVDSSNIQLTQHNDWNKLAMCATIPANLEVEYRSYPYTTFINYWMKDNSYISVNFKHYTSVRVKDKNLKAVIDRALKRLNELAFANLIADIEELMLKKQSLLSAKKIQQRHLDLTNSRIAHYVYSCIEQSSKLNFVD